jgi:hypothetical protein
MNDADQLPRQDSRDSAIHIEGPGRLTHRVFGLAVGALLLIVSLVSWHVFGHRPYWAFVVGGIFLTIAVVAPWVLLPVNLIWHGIARRIGTATNWGILGLIFYFILTPTGIILRLIGHDPIARKGDRLADSYFKAVRRQSNAENMRDWF